MEIINLMKKYGVLIAEDVLEEVKSLSYDEMKTLERKISEEKPIFIDKNFILSIKTPKIDIIEVKLKEKVMNLEEFVEVIQNYYDIFSDMIKNKMNPLKLVSISSIKDKGNYGIIGMIRSIDETEDYISVELEDKTGSIGCVVKKELVKDDENTLYVDEVIGIEGKYENGKFYAERIIFPDVEEIKEHKFEKDAVLYVRNDIDTIRVSINGKFFSVKDPVILLIDNLNVLVFINKQNINPKIYLKKRTLFPGKISVSGIIQTTPHLVITTHTPGYRENYKGVKIIGLEPKEELRIRLKDMKEVV